MKVYLNDPIAQSAIERLKSHVEIVDNFDHPEELDAIIVRQQYCTGDVIRKAKRCKLIQQHGVGLETFRETLYLSIDAMANGLATIDVVIYKLSADHYVLDVDVVAITACAA